MVNIVNAHNRPLYNCVVDSLNLQETSR